MNHPKIHDSGAGAGAGAGAGDLGQSLLVEDLESGGRPRLSSADAAKVTVSIDNPVHANKPDSGKSQSSGSGAPKPRRMTNDPPDSKPQKPRKKWNGNDGSPAGASRPSAATSYQATGGDDDGFEEDPEFENKFCSQLGCMMCIGMLALVGCIVLVMLVPGLYDNMALLEEGTCSLVSPVDACRQSSDGSDTACFEDVVFITLSGLSAPPSPVRFNNTCVATREAAGTLKGSVHTSVDTTNSTCLDIAVPNNWQQPPSNVSWSWTCMYDGKADDLLLDPNLNTRDTRIVAFSFVVVGVVVTALLSCCLCWRPCYRATDERVEWLMKANKKGKSPKLCSKKDLSNPCIPLFKVFIILALIPWLIWYLFMHGGVKAMSCLFETCFLPLFRAMAACCETLCGLLGRCCAAIARCIRPCCEALGRCCQAFCRSIAPCLRACCSAIGRCCEAVGRCVSAICTPICRAVGACCSATGRCVSATFGPPCRLMGRCCRFVWRTIAGCFGCVWRSCMQPCGLAIKRCLAAVCVPIGRGIAAICRPIGRAIAAVCSAIANFIRSVFRSLRNAFS